MRCSRLATYVFPKTYDPDVGQPCPHRCDVTDFEGGASYDDSTRKLSIFPGRIEVPRIYIVKCAITDKGYPPKTTMRVVSVKFVESLN